MLIYKIIHFKRYADLVVDFSFNLVKFIWEPNQEIKKVFKKTFTEDIIPQTMKHFENKLKENNTGFLIGKKLTFVDLALFRIVENVEENFLFCRQMVLDSNPLVKAHYEKISSIPNIAEWIKNRPNFIY